MADKANVFIIIPAFNEANRIESVIKELHSENFDQIIVIDDGSTDGTGNIADSARAKVIRHIINRGPGAATQTGLTYAKDMRADIAVTIDADGQHNPKDIHKLIEEMDKGNFDIVFGSRIKNKNNKIPLLRRFFNFVANFITFLVSFKWVTDSQSGMKALNRNAIEKIKIKTNGFEFCTEIWMQVRENKFKYKEVPIDVYYDKETMKKGQSFATGITTVSKLFMEALSRSK